MKTLFLLGAALLGTGGVQVQPVTVPTLGPRYKQTRERADILFGRRDGSYPLPDPRFGVFQGPAEPPPPVASTPKSTPTQKPPGYDEALLEEVLAVLTKGNRGKGGIVVTPTGRTVLTVGQRVYREGDTLSVPVRGTNVEVRIARISGNSVTLALNENEVFWRF